MVTQKTDMDVTFQTTPLTCVSIRFCKFKFNGCQKERSPDKEKKHANSDGRRIVQI